MHSDPCGPVLVSLCTQPEKGWLEGLGSWTLCTRQGGQPEGIEQSPDKGLVVPLEKTQTWVSLRLKLLVPGLPRSHKGNVVCGSWREEEEALRVSLGTGLIALHQSHSSLRR